MKKLRVVLVSFLLTIMAGSGIAHAQSTGGSSGGTSLSDFFNVSPQDKSAQLLSAMFGPSAFQSATGFTGGAVNLPTSNNKTEGGILGVLSGVMNLACMTVTVLIIGWGYAVFNLNAAYEGSRAAQRYNTLWVPMRSVFSFAMLMPVVGGYSLIQVLIMKGLFLGIGIGNAGYRAVLDYVDAGNPTVPIVVDGVAETASNLLASEVCSASSFDPLSGQRLVYPQSSSLTEGFGTNSIGSRIAANSVVVFFSGPPQGKQTFQLVYSGVPGSGLPAGVCGSFDVSQSMPSNDVPAGPALSAFYAKKLAAFQNLRGHMAAIADQVVRTNAPSDINSAAPSDTPSSTTGSIDPALVSDYLDAVARFRGEIFDAAGAARTAIYTPDQTANVDGLHPIGGREALRNYGWIFTGALYWNFQALNRETEKLLQNSVKSNGVDLADLSRNTLLPSHAQFVAAANTYQALMSRVESDNAFSTSTKGYQSVKKYIQTYGNPENSTKSAPGKVWNWIVDNVIELSWLNDSVANFLTSENGDTVANLSSIGTVLWNYGIVSISVSAISSYVSGADDKKSDKEGIVGGLVKKLPVVGGLIRGVASLLSAIAIPCLLVGFFLTYYLPFIPLILWTINITGWIIQALKAVFAGPIWAAAHSIPEGEGIAGQHARQGYTLMIGIVLRPLLLVTGILAGAVVVNIVGLFLKIILPVMLADFDLSEPNGMFGILAVLAIVAGIVVICTQKCFSLSHELADEILRWIGGGTEQLGDHSAHQEARGLIVGGSAGKAIEIFGRSAQQARESNERAKGAAAQQKDQQKHDQT